MALTTASLAIATSGTGHAADPMVVTGTTNPTTMATALIAKGVRVVSAQYEAGAPGWYSLFPFSKRATESYTGITVSGTYTAGPLGIANGLIMTSGEATLAVPPNRSLPFTVNAQGNPIKEGATGVLNPDIGPPAGRNGEQEPFCASLIGGATRIDANGVPGPINPHDVVKLTIDFTLDPGFDGIQLDYVFGSEEYPESVGGDYPDAFGFWVRPFGDTQFTNFALDPSGANININGPFFASDEVLKTYGEGAPQLSEYNGLTPRLRSSFPLPSGTDKVHRMVVVICDAGDQYLDSGVWLSALAGCAGNCSATTWCGNGRAESGEECDDDNNVEGDGCSTGCRIEPGYACLNQATAPSVCVLGCGNGITATPHEQCDDLNQSNRDDCTNGCRVATCTDGYLHDAGTGNETGVDCGGSCTPCQNGNGCKIPADCASGYCDQALFTCTSPPAPNAIDDNWNVVAGTSTSLAATVLQTNDQFVSAQTFSLLATQTTAAGIISYSTASGLLTYVPPAGFGGQDSFIYSICSPYSAAVCDTATVRIKVNRPPAVADKTQWIAVGTPSVTLAASAVYNDPDNDAINNTRTLAAIAGGANAAVQADGSIMLVPQNPTVGATWVVTVTMCDSGDPFACDTGTWTVIYNDPPLLSDQVVKLAGGESTTLPRSLYLTNFGAIRGDDPLDGDVDGVTNTYVATTVNGSYGTAKSLGIATCSVDAITGAVTLVAVQGLSGSATCFVKVCEELPANDGRVCSVATINVAVVQCTGDASCPGGVCDQLANQCSPCLNTEVGATPDVGCPLATPYCEVVEGALGCVPCNANEDAGAIDNGCNASLPVCFLGGTPRVCVQCINNADCDGGEVCDLTQHLCVACLNTQASGAIDAGCTADRPACSVAGSGNICVKCLADPDCGAGTVCSPGLRMCVACRDTAPAGGIDNGCRAGVPVCKGSGDAATCVTCIDDHGSGVDSGCSTNLPSCDPSGASGAVCLGCVVSDDCANGLVCDEDRNLCVTCQDTDIDGGRDEGCPAAKPICGAELQPIQCIACRDDRPVGETDSGCSDVAPACDPTAIGGPRCIGCDTSAPCPNDGVCDPLTGGCVACRDDVAGGGRDEGCTTQRPICDTVAEPDLCVPCIDSLPEGGVDFGCDTFAPSCRKDVAGGPRCVPCSGNEDCGPDEVCAAGINECVPVDEATAVDDSYQTNQDTVLVVPQIFGVIANDVAPQGLAAWAELLETTRPPSEQGTLEFSTSGAFSFTPAAGYHGVVSFGYDLKATGKAPSRGNVTLRVNGRPMPLPDRAATTVGNTATIAVIENDTDPEGDALHVQQLGQTVYADFTSIDPQNRVIYQPRSDFRGVESFDYTVCDVYGACATSNITVTVGELSGATALGDAASTVEDTTVRIVVTVNDDPRLVLQGVETQPRHGLATRETDGTISYRPAENWNGIDFFQYETCLAGGGCSTPWVRVNVAPDNDGPRAGDDAVTTQRDAFVDIAVMTNDYDIDGEVLGLPTITDPPQNGTAVRQNDGRVRFTPFAGFEGIDLFSYTVCDPNALCATASVVVKVGGSTGANRVPLPVDDATSTPEGTTVAIAVLVNDVELDGQDQLVLSGTCTPAHGAASPGPGGAVLYTPTPYYVGTDRFCYTVCDTAGSCASAMVVVTVTAGLNEPPIGIDDFAATPVGIPFDIRPLENDIDPNGDALAILEVSDPGHGSASLHADGSITYSPSLGFVGDDAFDVKISDGRGGTDLERVVVRVSPAFNRPPDAVDDDYVVSSIQSTALAVQQNDSDLDGDARFIASFTEPSDGLVSLLPDGDLTYKPRALLPGGGTGPAVALGAVLGMRYEIVDARGARDVALVTLRLSDRDQDGIADDIEEEIGTDPDDPDTDHDRIKDGVEVAGGADPVRRDPEVDTNPLDADTDDDGVSDGDEVITFQTDPFVCDTDLDGLCDGLELGVTKPVLPGVSVAGVAYVGTDYARWEPDLDSESTTDPLDDDSDDDSITDGHEDANANGRVDNSLGATNTTGTGETDPNALDTDGDGLQDGTEKGNIAAEGTDTDPLTFIADRNPLTVTSPLDVDTDDGSVSDGAEDTNKNGRVDADERDPNDASDDVKGHKGPSTFMVEGGGCSAGPDWTIVGLGAFGAYFAYLALSRRRRARPSGGR